MRRGEMMDESYRYQYESRNLADVVREHDRLKRISVEDLEKERLAKFQSLVDHHYSRNSVYRQLLDERGVKPKHIKKLSDKKILPIIESKDILKYGEQFFSEPDSIRTFFHSSGSTGESKLIPVSMGEESRRFTQNSALGFYVAGIQREDRVYCTFACGPWPGSFFAHNGCELLGPTDKADMGLPLDWHFKNIPKLKAKYLVAYPAFVSYLATEAKKKGIDLTSFGFEKVILGGEPFGENFRSNLEDLFKSDVIDIYGCAEIGIASMECLDLKSSGFHHILAHDMLMEVRKTGTEDQLLRDGEEGEMIVTPLFRSAIPIVRYNMKDIITLYPHDKVCSCGLNLPLMSRIKGRTDHMFTYGGANIYPDMFLNVLDGLGIGDKFQVVKKKDAEGLNDELIINIELDSNHAASMTAQYLREGIESGMRKKSPELNNSFARGIINPFKVELYEHGKLYKGGKFKRFIDEGSE